MKLFQDRDRFAAIDIRLQLLLLPLLVGYGFSSANLWAVCPVLVLLLLIVFFSGCHLLEVVRIFVRLRWLFFVTVLMYRFFSTGRLLFGMTWLSLDGVWRGALVCLQIGVAAVAAWLLGRNGSERLAAGLAGLFAPLAVLGLPVKRWSVLAALSMKFVVPLEDIGRRLLLRLKQEKPQGVEARVRLWGRLLDGVLVELLDNVEGEARALASGSTEAALPALRPWRLAETLFALPLLVVWGLLFGSLL